MSSTITRRPARERPSTRRVGFGFESVIGDSRSLRRSIDMANKVAKSPSTTVLLVGETGTGKELFARGIHYAGPNAGDPFVAINCSAIPENLLESELFGHEKGAFTGAGTRKRGLLELAGNGTVFLDEIGELAPSIQPKLLRILEEKRLRRLGGLEEIGISCRLITATNRMLEEAVARGEFRADLFYRLNVFRVDLPPLRERQGDVRILAKHFLETLAEEQGMRRKCLTSGAVEALETHRWPGNVRELKNVIERAAILADGQEIDAEHVMVQRRLSIPAVEDGAAPGMIRIPRDGKSLEEVESETIEYTLELTRGNQSAAARILEISRPTLTRKIRKYDLRIGRTKSTV